MHDDDTQKGRLLNRREVLTLLGGAGGALAAGWSFAPGVWALDAAQASSRPSASSAAGCIVRPETTEGPYFLDRQLERVDIRVEPTTGAPTPGAPLALAFNVSQMTGGTCGALSGAVVDVWQCDAAGVYSGVSDPQSGASARGRTFLRGYQTTDRNGTARFSTIYPGWYRGRPVHVHFKIRTMAAGQPYEFTSQLYFDEALTDRVHAQAPYASKGRRDTMNRDDGIFRGDGGENLLLAVRESAGAYTATFDIGLDLSNTAAGRPDGFGGGGRGRGRGRGV